MVFADNPETLGTVQAAQESSETLITQSGSSFAGAGTGQLVNRTANGQNTAPRLEVENVTVSNFTGEDTSAAVEFSPNPVLANIERDESSAQADGPTDLTGTDFVGTPLSDFRLNVGGGTYTDEWGKIWQADRYFSNGSTEATRSNTAKTNDSIAETQDDGLYQSHRYSKNLGYRIPVANGTYDIKLHFAETFWKDSGKRLFDVAIESKTVIGDLDIVANKGRNKALKKGFNKVVIQDGQLDIDLSATQDQAQLAGIEIKAVALSNEAPTGKETDQTSPDKSIENRLENTSESKQPASKSLSNSQEQSQNNSQEKSQTKTVLPKPEIPTSQTKSSPVPTGKGAVRYISPEGNGDGSSWEKAAGLSDLANLIEKSSPGDEILLAGDLGTYNVVEYPVAIRSGSTEKAPIFIRGAASRAGGKETPLFVSDRDENWAPGKRDGQEVFRLLNGANHLHFSNLDFKNVGNGAFRLGGNLTGITLEDMSAKNVRRFVENTASGSAKSASVKELTIRDVKVEGFSKSAIRLQYDTQNVLIEDVYGDSQGQDGDVFAMGVNLAGSVNNVVHRRVTMKNATQKGGKNDYWNADGFVTEENTYNITYEDTFASGNTDGGYDLKSNNTVLIRAKAADNKRNFRIWGDATMYDVASDDPLRRGGIGTNAHIHVLEDANLTIEGASFTGSKKIENIVFDVDDQAKIVVNNAVIKDNLYTLKTAKDENIQLNNVVEK